MLPSTAMPSAPPSSRVVSLTAEPTPALLSGTDDMIAPVAGGIVSAMPPASSTQRDHDHEVRGVRARSNAITVKPAAIAGEADGDDLVEPEPLDQPVAARGDDDHRQRERAAWRCRP